MFSIKLIYTPRK